MGKIITFIITISLSLTILWSLNISEVSSAGYGIDLPIGWVEPQRQEGIGCAAVVEDSKGLPFATSKQGHYCQTAHNPIAIFLNIATAAGLGVLATLLINRPRFKKSKQY